MPDPQLFLVLLGPPMSGKGTQAVRLTEELGIPHISSGDLFRDNIKNETALGREAKVYIDRGDLVPDKVTIGMVEERLTREDCQKGALLDGFPRTIPQAKELDAILGTMNTALGAVFSISVPDDVLVERASGRRICRKCGRSYHIIFDPPEEPGICDADGGELYQREDDQPDTVRQRLAVYQQQTSPLIEYYRSQDKLYQVNGNQAIENVAGDLKNLVKSLP